MNAYLLLAAIVVSFKYFQDTPEELQVSDLKDPPFLKCCCSCKALPPPPPPTTSDSDDTQSNSIRSIPWYIQLMWVLYIISSQLSIPVVLGYWGLSLDVVNWPITLHEHLLVIVPVMLDVFVTSYPVRFYHFIYSSTFGAVYIIFSVIYYIAGGTNSNGDRFIYSAIDYEESLGRAIIFIIVLCTLVPVLLNSFYWACYLLRTFLVYTKLKQGNRGGSQSTVSVRALKPSSIYSRNASTDSSLALVKKEDVVEDGTVVSSIILDVPN